MKIVLSQTEIAICNMIGKLRHQITAEYKKDRKQDKTQDAVQMVINGVITEYAVSKALNLHFDLNCDYREQYPPDLISNKGFPVEVKCTSKPGGNLNAPKWSTYKPSAVFVLTEIHPSHVQLVGWIYKEDFLIAKNLTDIGNGPFYSIPQSQLIPFNEQTL